MTRVLLTVDSRIRLDVTELPEPRTRVLAALREAFTHSNPQHAKLKRMGYPAYKEPPVIRTYKVTDSGEISFPRGGMRRVREVLRAHGVQWTTRDDRRSPPRVDMPEHRVSLRRYQEDHVAAALARENCLIRAPTGSGKTTTGIAFVARAGYPALVIVYDGGLLNQWIERAENELGIPKRDIGVIRGSKLKLKPVTVAMQQTLSRLSDEAWREVDGYFGTVVCDEVQRFAAKTFMSVIDRLSARYRLGVSADETRKDRKEFLVYDMFGEVAAEVTTAELVEQEFVHEVEVRVVPTDFRADWYRPSSSDRSESNFNKLLEQMTGDADRNDLIVRLVQQIEDEGEQCLVFSHRREHCVELSSLLAEHAFTSGLLLGGDSDAEEFARSVAQLRERRLRIGIGTIQAIGQGLDLPSVARGVVTTPVTSNRQMFNQARGRLCRPAEGKEDAVMYVVWDRHVFGAGPIRNLKRWNRRVLVLDGLRWVEASKYLEAYDAKANERDRYPF